MKTSFAAESIPLSPAPGAGKPGRPPILTEEITQQMCKVIRHVGLSDSAAGLLAGVSTSSVSRWKQHDPEFKRRLGQARVEFIVPRLEAIGQAKRRDGSLDWRAQKWLIEYADPERFGKPSRRRSVKTVKLKPQEKPAPGQVVVTPEHLEAMQQRRLAMLSRLDSVPEDEAQWILVYGMSAPYPGPGWQETAPFQGAGARRPVFPKTPEASEVEIASAQSGTLISEPAPPRAEHNATFLPKTPPAEESSTPAPTQPSAPVIPKTPAAPQKHGAGAPRLLDRVTRLFRKEAPAAKTADEQAAAAAFKEQGRPRPVSHKTAGQVAKLRAAAELEAHRRAVEALENAPDLYPESYYDPREVEARHALPGMWAGY